MVEFVDGITRLDLSQGYSINSLILNKMTDSPNTFSKSLGSINIKDNSNLIIKTWQFNYDYFVDPNPLKTFMYQNNCVGVITSPVVDVSTLNSDKYKLKLLSVQEFSAEPQINLPAYQFDYFDSVIRNLSMNLDHWGFNNFDGVNTNTDLIPSLYLRGSLYMQSSCNSYVTNRNSNWPAMRGGTLKKITYPTGGNIQFEFEPNTVLNENNLNTIVGGLRIKKIIKDFKNNIPIEITDYQYNENNGNSSGVLYGTPYYFQVIKNEMLSTALGCEKSGCDCTSDSLSSYYSSNSIKPLELTQGSHIGYKTVKEIYKNNGYKIRTFFDDKSNYNYSALPFQNFISNQITSNTTTGYKIFYNSIPSLSCIDNIDAPNFPTPPQPFFPTRGALTSEKIYDENGKLKKQTDYLTKFKLSYIAIPGIQSIVFFIRRYS
ncbi:MAG: hypothetical protein ORN85_02590, partial [Sediminibacterium sp.]|nr:hypothetical protein [Sediminibacterium sp.]